MLNLDKIDLVNNHTDQVKVFLYSFLVWTGIFTIINQKVNFKNFPKKTVNDIKNRIVSILHGVLTFWAASLIVISEFQGFGAMNSQSMQFLMIVSAAYFAYDFIACVYYDLSDVSLVCHHALAMTGYAVSIMSKFGAPPSIWGLMSAEVSNFPMHMRCIVRSLGLRYTRLYEAFEWTYFALYIIFRGGLVPYMVFNSIMEPSIPLIVKLSATGLFLQSVYFIFEMKKIIKRQYHQFNERKRKNVHYFWLSVNPKITELSYTRKDNKECIF